MSLSGTPSSHLFQKSPEAIREPHFTVDDVWTTLRSGEAQIAYRRGKGEGLFDDLKAASTQLGISDRIAYARQIHSNTVISVDSPGFVGEGDGLITDSSEVALAIQVADCVPVFLMERGGKARGLIHAGWKGTLRNIAREGVAMMVSTIGTDVNNLHCFLGPSIRSCCYQIGKDVAEQFRIPHLTENGGNRYTLDLHRTNLDQLIEAGVNNENISFDTKCTCCSKNGLHSFRRDTDAAGRNICFLRGMNNSDSSV
ncbi:MAG: polyphenol oxidoreductase [Candidatus Marinimicrobia bacterium]|nr:polyphenol oxidoreductase [Candidatus Neomarinimicrobiota bacterium]